MMLTGPALVRRKSRSVLATAGRIADIPKDLTQINKRSVHRSFDVLGGRAAMRAATELQALAGYSEAAKAVVRRVAATN